MPEQLKLIKDSQQVYVVTENWSQDIEIDGEKTAGTYVLGIFTSWELANKLLLKHLQEEYNEILKDHKDLELTIDYSLCGFIRYLFTNKKDCWYEVSITLERLNELEGETDM